MLVRLRCADQPLSDAWAAVRHEGTFVLSLESSLPHRRLPKTLNSWVWAFDYFNGFETARELMHDGGSKGMCVKCKFRALLNSVESQTCVC